MDGLNLGPTQVICPVLLRMYYLSSNILGTIRNNETQFVYVMLPASMVSTYLLFGTEYVSYDQDKSGQKKVFALSFDLP